MLTFGVNLVADDARPDLVPSAARRAEEDGFDVVTVADHVGAASPVVCLAAAAAVTTTVRLRTYVLDVGWWNAGLLARDVATLDALSGGRVEVGLGAGHVPEEHAAIGLEFEPYAARVELLARFAADLTARLADAGHVPPPVQRPVPVQVAAMSPAGLRTAALAGTGVALSGLLRRPGGSGFVVASSEQTDAAVALVTAQRSAAGLPPAPLDALLQQVVVDGDPAGAAEAIEERTQGRLRAEQVLDSPFLLLAPSPREAALELRRRRDRWGITSWCTHAPSGPALAEVLRAARQLGE